MRGSISTLILASRASANSSSLAGTSLTTTVYFSSSTGACGAGRIGVFWTSSGICPAGFVSLFIWPGDVSKGLGSISAQPNTSSATMPISIGFNLFNTISPPHSPLTGYLIIIYRTLISYIYDDQRLLCINNGLYIIDVQSLHTVSVPEKTTDSGGNNLN